MMQTIGTTTFRSELVRESTYRVHRMGSHESTMTLYADGPRYFIEWDVPSIEETEHIGLVFEHRTLTDYDGVMSLPTQAIALLRNHGFIVPKEFEE